MMTLRMPRRLSPAGFPHRGGALVVLLATFALGGCEVLDIIEDPPEIQPRLIVDGENTTLTVAQLLPSSVTISGNNFNLSLAGATSTRTLGDLCGAPCAAFPDNTTVIAPKPAFTADITTTLNLPADVRSAALVSGSLVVRLANNLGFDPVNPPGALSSGSVAVTLSSGTTTLATRTLAGPAETFPNGSTRDVTIPLSAANITGPIVARVTINSPATATPVEMRKSNSFSVTGTPQTLLLSSATVGVTNRSVNVNQVTFDFEGIDDTIKDRIVRGALIVTVTNPFNVTG